MTMLLVIILCAGGLILIVNGNGLLGVILIAIGVHLMQWAKGDPVEDLATLMFGVVLIGGFLALISTMFR